MDDREPAEQVIEWKLWMLGERYYEHMTTGEVAAEIATELRAAGLLVEGETEVEGCGECYACVGDQPTGIGFLTVGMTQMIVCPTCGNKRCPHGTDHRNDCTGSNEPGQVGSRYGRTNGGA